MNNESVDDILIKIFALRNAQHDIEKIINNLKDYISNEINILEKKLFIECNHIWINDSSNYSEHTDLICSKCNLYQNRYLYFNTR